MQPGATVQVFVGGLYLLPVDGAAGILTKGIVSPSLQGGSQGGAEFNANFVDSVVFNTAKPAGGVPAGVTADARAFYVDMLAKVRATPEWKEFMEQGAFNQTAISGEEFIAWVSKEELRHQKLMQEAGFLAKP